MTTDLSNTCYERGMCCLLRNHSYQAAHSVNQDEEDHLADLNEVDVGTISSMRWTAGNGLTLTGGDLAAGLLHLQDGGLLHDGPRLHDGQLLVNVSSGLPAAVIRAKGGPALPRRILFHGHRASKELVEIRGLAAEHKGVVALGVDQDQEAMGCCSGGVQRRGVAALEGRLIGTLVADGD